MARFNREMDAAIAKADEAISGASWTKTDYIADHEYVMQEKMPDLYAALEPVIRKQGYDAKFKGWTYRYWNHGGHNVWAHYGVRTLQHKLIHFYTPSPSETQSGSADTPQIEPYWELFDLRQDQDERRNVYDDPRYAQVQRQLHEELDRLLRKYGDKPPG